ncbi:MAG TPA: hypothetical protein VEH55_02190 [Gaiellaceae bacterium]|nr:hypothetical protein [Gaiellaceae bacterium]
MARRWSVAAWAAAQSPVSLLVVRLLVVANVLVLSAVGGLSLLFVALPAGAVGAAVSWSAVAALLWLLPYTNPRRGGNSRW